MIMASQNAGKESDGDLASGRQHNIARTVAAFLVVAALAVAPGLLLLHNIRDSAARHNLYGSAPLSPPADNYYGVPTETYSPEHSDLCVTFGFLTLNPATSLADFSVLVGATPHGKNMLKRLSSHGYNSVLLVVSSNLGLSSIDIPIPFSALEHGQTSSCGGGSPTQKMLLTAAGFRAIEGIFVIGQPRAYPQDWYYLNDSVNTYATRRGSERRATGPIKNMELASSLVMMTRDEDLPMSVDMDQPSATTLRHRLSFVIRRPKLIICYTYIIAAMPFLLLMILGAFQYLRQRSVPEFDQISAAPTRATRPAGPGRARRGQRPAAVAAQHAETRRSAQPYGWGERLIYVAAALAWTPPLSRNGESGRSPGPGLVHRFRRG
jgi:hypothetical protein